MSLSLNALKSEYAAADAAHRAAYEPYQTIRAQYHKGLIDADTYFAERVKFEALIARVDRALMALSGADDETPEAIEPDEQGAFDFD